MRMNGAVADAAMETGGVVGTMLVQIATVAAAVYAVLSALLVLLVAGKIAKPPWHKPRPGRRLTDRWLPVAWAGAVEPADVGLSVVDVVFGSYAGLILRGWLVLGRGRGTARAKVGVVCVHGAGRDRRAFLRHAVFLRDCGLDVLLFDCSNHGISDAVRMWPLSPWPGRSVSLGKREHLDVVAAVRFMRTRGIEKVVVMGTSQGATSAIIAAAKLSDAAPSETPDALIVENPFASPEDLVAPIVQAVFTRYKLPYFPVLRRALEKVTVWLGLFRTGNLPRRTQLRAINFVSSIHIPIFFIHGTEDVLVSSRQSVRLHALATHPAKDIWIVDGAPHTQCYHTAPLEFEARVISFLQKALGTW